jgi:hypothetical protein
LADDLGVGAGHLGHHAHHPVLLLEGRHELHRPAEGLRVEGPLQLAGQLDALEEQRGLAVLERDVLELPRLLKLDDDAAHLALLLEAHRLDPVGRLDDGPGRVALELHDGLVLVVAHGRQAALRPWGRAALALEGREALLLLLARLLEVGQPLLLGLAGALQRRQPLLLRLLRLRQLLGALAAGALGLIGRLLALGLGRLGALLKGLEALLLLG